MSFRQRNPEFPQFPIPRSPHANAGATFFNQEVNANRNNTSLLGQGNTTADISASNAPYAMESSPQPLASSNSEARPDNEEEINVPNAYEPELNRSNYIGIIDGREGGREMGFEKPITINSIQSIVGYNPELPINQRWFVKPAPGLELPYSVAFTPIYVANKEALITSIGLLYDSLPMAGGRRKRNKRSKKSKKSRKNKTSKKSKKSRKNKTSKKSRKSKK